jgi:hypothetical protein
MVRERSRASAGDESTNPVLKQLSKKIVESRGDAFPVAAGSETSDSIDSLADGGRDHGQLPPSIEARNTATFGSGCSSIIPHTIS